MSDSACECDVFVFPQPVANPPGRTRIAYRVGTYTGFRHALLRAPDPAAGLPLEIELTQWRPSADGDLALQMMEWWAYLADILTFYNERRASDSYLATVEQPESVNRLIRVLGYRPRPGIGATAILAGRVDGIDSFTLPKGFQIQSKPGPGKEPQIFELDADTTLLPLDSVEAAVPPESEDAVGTETIDLNGTPTGVYRIFVAGVSTKIKKGDEVLLLQRGAVSSSSGFALVDVVHTETVKDADGKSNTKVHFQYQGGSSLPAHARWTDYRVMKSAQSAHAWQFPTDAAHPALTTSIVHLDALTRGIKLGDPIVFEVPGGSPSIQLSAVGDYQEAIWYANGKGQDPTTSPDPKTEVPIPIPHTVLSLSPALGSAPDHTKVVVRYAWQEVGDLIAAPAKAAGAGSGAMKPKAGTFPAPAQGRPVIVEDGNGNGAPAIVTAGGDLKITDAEAALVPPLHALFNPLVVSRGATVGSEILGSGDGTIPGQEFVLAKSPLTYLQDPSSVSGNDYKSTLTVRVDGVAWTEVASFYGRGPNAQVFVTREDETGKTHVQFGDGVHGARLPTGKDNVVATYRIGSGKTAPDRRTLTTILKPWPHLRKVRNPIAAGGGADPDPPEQIQQYAPRSVLTFGRAVSFDDYETIAAQAPGVARARAYFTWDGGEQRTLVKVYVGDDDGAVASAQKALNGASDPNKPVAVAKATAVAVWMYFVVVVDPRHDPAAVVAAVRSAMVDADAGLLGAHAVRIGQSLFASEIDAACLAVPGVRAINDLWFWGNPSGTGYRFDPGEGGYFTLEADRLFVFSEVAQGA